MNLQTNFEYFESISNIGSEKKQMESWLCNQWNGHVAIKEALLTTTPSVEEESPRTENASEEKIFNTKVMMDQIWDCWSGTNELILFQRFKSIWSI